MKTAVITAVQKRARRKAGNAGGARGGLVIGACSAWLILMLLTALLGPQLTPYDYSAIDLLDRLSPPGQNHHLLGTDHLGRDIFSRLIVSIRLTVLVAVLATIIGALLGTAAGVAAAHFRGRVDDLVMVFVDFQAAIPFMIIALAVLAFAGNKMPVFIAVLGIQGWEKYARIARGMTLSAQKQSYVAAVRSLGLPHFRVYWRHILPNISSALIVNLTLNFPETILWESALSFLGLGVQPPEPAWARCWATAATT